MFHAELHLHPQSLYDSSMDPEVLAERIIKMGGMGCALTDHGAVSAIEDFRRVFAEKGLKAVPGCELYVDGGILGRMHLIVLARDDKGWEGIKAMVTEANRNQQEHGGNFPVIDEDTVFKIAGQYRGHIYALSACMQGVINTVFLKNSIVKRKIEKERGKLTRYISPDSDEYHRAEQAVKDAAVARTDAVNLRDQYRKLSGKKFAMADKKAAAMKDGPEKDAVLKQIAEEKTAAKNAQDHLQEAVDEAKRAAKALSAAQKTLKADTESVRKYNDIMKQIRVYESDLTDEDTLFHEAEEKAKAYRNAFGEKYFYIEMQYHGIPAEKDCFPKSCRVAKTLGIPLVATNDVHIITNSNAERRKRRTLRSLRFGTSFAEENTGDDQLYLKSEEEMREALSRLGLPASAVEEAVGNISRIFDDCNVSFEHDKHYPMYKFTEEENRKYKGTHAEKARKMFLDLIYNGCRDRFPHGFPKGQENVYKKRINYEYSIIRSMGYIDYHLIVRDYITYGRLLGYVPKELISEAPLSIKELREYIRIHGWKNPGYYIGTGRGSAVGSLICYCIGITNLDPIKYDLLFERFLNPERVSMPDIDVDFAQTIREKCIEYVKNKYGRNAVCGIMTKTMEQTKKAIDTAARFYGMENNVKTLPVAAEMKAMVPKDPKTTFSSLVDENGNLESRGTKTLYQYMDEKCDSREKRIILRWAQVMEGSFVGYGAHAAGIVISDNDDVSKYLPLRYNNSPKIHDMTTQCDMVQVEENGLLKFDFLGLKTCDIITETLKMIERNYGKVIDVLKLDTNDQNVYKSIFQTGRTEAVFQFGSSGMKLMLIRFKPNKFEDLIILVSMYRPGPVQFLDDVIAVKNGEKKMTFLCPQLEPILGKTYGAITYQEQVMQIFQQLAGYTLGGADMVRRYMSKKKAEKLAKERKAFIYGDPERKIRGCVANGIDAKAANALFDQMMAFASYAFNKSHAAAYAYNAYITAWLKYYYPAEFFAAALNWAADTDELSALMQEAKTMGVKVCAPDVNLSEKEFSVTDGVIRFGLGAVKGVKDRANEIISERENGRYLDIADFLKRTHVNRTVLSNLIDAGALDEISRDKTKGNRAAIHQYAEDLKESISRWKDCTRKLKASRLLLPVCETLSDEETVALQEKKGITPVPYKNAVTVEKLNRRIEELKVDLDQINREIMSVLPERITENVYDKLDKEKELLGLYVTGNPLNGFLPAEEQNALTPAQLAAYDEEGNVNVVGYVTDLEEKHGPKAKYYTFNIADENGFVRCLMFESDYDKCKEFIVNSHPVFAEVEKEDKEFARVHVFSAALPTKVNSDKILVEKKPGGKTDPAKYRSKTGRRMFYKQGRTIKAEHFSVSDQIKEDEDLVCEEM